MRRRKVFVTCHTGAAFTKIIQVFHDGKISSNFIRSFLSSIHKANLNQASKLKRAEGTKGHDLQDTSICLHAPQKITNTKNYVMTLILFAIISI